MNISKFLLSCAALSLLACNQADTNSAVETVVTDTQDAASSVVQDVTNTVTDSVDSKALLQSILVAQPDEVRARYSERHPAATLNFFGVQPGMTVAEILPGGGWYSKIILPYVGDEGALIGIDYSVPMWGKFGGFATPEFLEKRESWGETWTADAQDWRAGSDADISAFAFGSLPEAASGSVDVVLFIRAFHHLMRFDRAYLGEALADTKALLKADGVVGIVQHRAPEGNPDDWANGDNGYVKQSEVIKVMEAAGFELVAKSDMNSNEKDQPTIDDKVWRLPPTLGTSRDDQELKAKMEAIGESDRMTLKFKIKD